MLDLVPTVVEVLLASRGLSVSQISRRIKRRIKAATKVAGLGEGFSTHSPRVGIAQDLSAAGRSCRS